MLLKDYDALVMSGGAEDPRNLEVVGREMDGIHYAMDFLTQQNKRVAGDDESKRCTAGTLSAKGKHVVVIGGGDTGSDCIGTSNRHGAASITQLEILSRPPDHEHKALTWPDWPLKLRTSSSHEEGCDRDWSVLTKRANRQRRQDRGARMRARRMAEGRRWADADGRGAGEHFRTEGRSGFAGDGLCGTAQGGARGAIGRRARRRAATSRPM